MFTFLDNPVFVKDLVSVLIVCPVCLMISTLYQTSPAFVEIQVNCPHSLNEEHFTEIDFDVYSALFLSLSLLSFETVITNLSKFGLGWECICVCVCFNLRKKCVSR